MLKPLQSDQFIIIGRQMYIDKIRQTFERANLTSNSQITRQNLYDVLSRLSPGQTYDVEVANELWDQASRGSEYIDVNSICQTINDGINILQVKLDQINEQTKELQKQKLRALNSSGPNKNILSKIETDIENLYQDRDEFEEDLRLVTIPFGINLNRNGRNSEMIRYNQSKSGLNESAVSNRSGTAKSQNSQLKNILYLSVVFGIIEIIIIYGKPDFLNLMVVTCLLSIYLLNHFDNIYIKLSLALIAISEVLDVFWLFLYADQNWNPPQVGNNASYQTHYLRFIVFFTVVIIFIKIPIAYFLYCIKNINEEEYKISVGLFKIILDANKSNPITRNLTNVIST